MCNVIHSFSLYMKTMAPRFFFSCLSFPFISVSEDLIHLRMPGWAGRKGWCSPWERFCTFGAADITGSSGALWWPMGNVQQGGGRRLWGIWKPAREATQSLLYRLPFVNYIIIFDF